MMGLLAGLCSLNTSHAIDIPTGTLGVDRTLVRVGTNSNLNWQIQYPTPLVTDVVSVSSTTGTITPKVAMNMRVRTLGVAFQSGSTLLPCEGQWSKNGSAFTRFFYGIGTAVDPTKVLIDTPVAANDKINFGGRGWSGSSWFPFHDTTKADQYVIVLKNGDSAPSYAPAYSQTSAKGFLAPYIDAAGKINIGSRDLIILWECSTAAPGTTYFDMQDLVVLVTFQ